MEPLPAHDGSAANARANRKIERRIVIAGCTPAVLAVHVGKMRAVDRETSNFHGSLFHRHDSVPVWRSDQMASLRIGTGMGGDAVGFQLNVQHSMTEQGYS